MLFRKRKLKKGLQPPCSKIKTMKKHVPFPAKNSKSRKKIYEICDKILICENNFCSSGLQTAVTEDKKCGKNYKIQKQELKFYRKMNLPISRKCPDCRHSERMKLRNPRKLFTRNCDNPNCKDKSQFVSTFSPDRPERVFCEKCYLENVN